MMTQATDKQIKFHMLTIESLVPEEHLLCKLERLVDFSFIYREVEDCYCRNNGRPSIDPVVLVKYLLLGFLYGIKSERRIEQEIQVNMAYRWFLGLDIDEPVPDHSTISYNRKKRLTGKELLRKLFEQVVRLCIREGLVEGKLILTDSTHVKANTSRQSEQLVEVEYRPAEYLSVLDVYEQEERKRLEESGRITPPKFHRSQKEKPKTVLKRSSKTDPDAGYYKRKGKPEGMHYLSHQSIDAAQGIIVDVHTTPGNVTDATPYVSRLMKIREVLGLDITETGANSGYDIGLVHQQLTEQNILFYTPINHEKPQYKSAYCRRDFSYQSDCDRFICPAGNGLPLKRLQRNEYGVYWEYQAKKRDCQSCPVRAECLTGSFPNRRLKVNLFEPAVKRNHAMDGSERHREVLHLRQVWCEGSFAAQKHRHNLRRLLRRGMEAATEHCLLSATALNVKRMIKCLG